MRLAMAIDPAAAESSSLPAAALRERLNFE